MAEKVSLADAMAQLAIFRTRYPDQGDTLIDPGGLTAASLDAILEAHAATQRLEKGIVVRVTLAKETTRDRISYLIRQSMSGLLTPDEAVEIEDLLAERSRDGRPSCAR